MSSSIIGLVAVPSVPDASFGCRELEPTLAKMVDAQRLVRHPYDNRHLHLRLSPTFIVLAGIAVVALTSSTLQADSIEGLNAGVFADRRPAAERIVHRRCWWRSSEKHCRRHSGNRLRVRRHRYGSDRQEPNLPPNLGWGL
jgi:hypothetical protein